MGWQLPGLPATIHDRLGTVPKRSWHTLLKTPAFWEDRHPGKYCASFLESGHPRKRRAAAGALVSAATVQAARGTTDCQRTAALAVEEREEAMVRGCLALLVVLAIAGVGGMGWSAEPAKTKIVLIATKQDHPPATHMYDFECKLLAKCLNQTPGVEAVVSPDFDWPADSRLLKDARSIVYYSRPAGDILLHPSRRDEVRKLLNAGVGLACIHWATAAEKEHGEEWLQTLGGWFHFAHSGLAVEKQKLVQAERDHPVCRGWQEYDLRDEFYLNLKFH
jgi:trehalose utilization protein